MEGSRRRQCCLAIINTSLEEAQMGTRPLSLQRASFSEELMSCFPDFRTKRVVIGVSICPNAAGWLATRRTCHVWPALERSNMSPKPWVRSSMVRKPKWSFIIYTPQVHGTYPSWVTNPIVHKQVLKMMATQTDYTIWICSFVNKQIQKLKQIVTCCQLRQDFIAGITLI